VQDTQFPRSEKVRISLQMEKPLRLPLRIRVPYWAAGASAALNGRRIEGFASPGSYFVLDRTWRSGDRLDLNMPMRLHAAAMPDDPSIQAVMFGPLVLAGKLGTAGLTAQNLRAEPTPPRTVPEYKSEPVAAPTVRAASLEDPRSWLEPLPGRPLEFRSTGQEMPLTLVPLNEIFDERYAVYWKVEKA
jgi:DUF1680 family protein